MKIPCVCGKTLQIPEALAGKRVRCPHCQAPVEVPAADLADLPVALDRPPTADELEARKPAAPPEPRPAPEPEPAPSAGADAAPAADPLAGLAAAASPEPPSKGRAATESADASTSDTDGLADLAAALDAPGGTAPAQRPSGPAKPGRVTPAKPRGAVVAAKAADDEDEAPKKKRDLLPLVISGSAIGLFLVIGVIMLIASMNKPAEKPKATNADNRIERPQAPQPTQADYADGSYDFFGHVKAGPDGNRTYKDYLREKEEKAQNKPNQP